MKSLFSLFLPFTIALLVTVLVGKVLQERTPRFHPTPPGSKQQALTGDGSGPACPVGKILGITQDETARGRALYAAQCASCHGAIGAGDGALAAFLHPRPRDFTSGLFKVRSTESGTPTDEDLYGIITQGMPGGAMPSFSHLSEQARRDLVAYVKHLSRKEENGQVFEWFKETPSGPSFPLPAKPDFTPELAAQGRMVYQKMDCANCHGADARGNGPQARGMKDLWGFSLEPRNLAADPYIGGSSDEAVYLRIAAGIGGTPMNAYPDSKMTPPERWALVAYIQSLRTVHGRSAATPDSAGAEEGIKAIRTAGKVPVTVGDPAWSGTPAAWVELQPVWRKSSRTRLASLRALHDGRDVAFLLEWTNPDPRTNDPRIQDFADRAALQFGLKERPGFIGMGDPFHPVNLWHWRAAEAPGASPADLASLAYPLKKTDIHPDAGPHYLTAAMAGNPVAVLGMDRFEESNARGPGTLTVQPTDGQNLSGTSTWTDGHWRVLFRRSLAPSAPEDIDLRPGRSVPFALGIWDGHNRDRDGQKNFSSWQILTIDP